MLLKLETKCALLRMRCITANHTHLLSDLDSSQSLLLQRLRFLTSNNMLLYSLIRFTIHVLNRQLYEFLCVHHQHKLNLLRPVPSTTPAPCPSLSSSTSQVVCIPPELPLSDSERSVLSKGLKFVPLRPTTDHYSTLQDLHRFHRGLRLKLHFHHRDGSELPPDSSMFAKFSNRKHDWTPKPGASNALDLYIKNTLHDIGHLHPKRLGHSNMSQSEFRALAHLRRRDDIVIKPADKGGAIVVWSKELYLKEGHNQLLNTRFYRAASTDVTLSNNKQVRTVIKNLITTLELPTRASSLCVIDSCLGKPAFYMLPKIHKPDNPGRPIVSACSCPTEHISEFLDSIFNPIVSTLPSFLKDTTHTLSVFSSIQLLPDRTYRLFLLDVCSLYTSIPNSDGLQALQFFLDRRTNPLVSTSTLLRLAELVLTLNSFQFNGQFFEQISGVAMGTKMGPSYACLFMGYLEHLVWHSYDGPLPSVYHRYIDDCIGITDMPEADLSRFIQFINGFNPAIRFTSHISTSFVNFLDITLTIKIPTISTSVYYKPTDTHSFLLYTSSHPQACRDALPFSQLLRLRRLCSEDDDFLDRAHDMLDFFRKRPIPGEGACFCSTARSQNCSPGGSFPTAQYFQL